MKPSNNVVGLAYETISVPKGLMVSSMSANTPTSLNLKFITSNSTTPNESFFVSSSSNISFTLDDSLSEGVGGLIQVYYMPT